MTVDFTTSSTAVGSRRGVLRVGIVAASSLVVALLLTAVAANAAEAAPQRSAPLIGAAGRGIVWSGCGRRLECAKVRVPLDWAHPGGREITLAVIRHLASRPDERIGSLFFNPGGPGNSGVGFVAGGGGDLLDGYVQGRFDVVSWDIRGSADVAPDRPGPVTTPVRCFANAASQARFWDELSVPTTPPASRRYRRKTAAYARRCGQLSGSLLGHLANADMARDLDYLRRLVGDRQLNYYGVSYGTFLGETYANMFPRRVRAMAIDGVVDPVAYTKGSEAAVANNTADSDRVFEGFQSVCQSAGPERCALATHGPVAARVQGLLRRLRRAPIPAPSADPPGALRYGDVLVELFGQLGHPENWPQLAQELDQATDGDGSALATASRQFFRAFRASPNGDGFSGIWCADSPARQGSRAWPQVIDQLTKVSRTRGPVLGWWAWAPCASWPARSANPYTGPWNASTKTPVLVMGIRFDPNTAFANARNAARRFGNAVLLTQQGYGHGTYTDPSACVDQALGKYLVDLVAPARGTVCPSDRQPFDPDFGKPLPDLAGSTPSSAANVTVNNTLPPPPSGRGFPRLSMVHFTITGTADAQNVARFDWVVTDQTWLPTLKQTNPGLEFSQYVNGTENNNRQTDTRTCISPQQYNDPSVAADAQWTDNWWLKNYDGTYPNNPGQTGRHLANVTPYAPTNAAGQRPNDHLAAYIKRCTVDYYKADGVLLDMVNDSNLYQQWPFWSAADRYPNVDLDRDGLKDTLEHGVDWVNRTWGNGQRDLVQKARAVVSPSFLITTNSGNGTSFYPWANGQVLEWTGVDNNALNMVRQWDVNHFGSPHSALITQNGSNTDYRAMRMGLAGALVGGAWNSYTCGAACNYTSQPWFDEYSVDVATGQATGDTSKKGYLGQPTGAPVKLTNGVWRRDFDHGIALLNNTSASQTVDLGGTFRKINGTQDHTTNSGASVSSVTIPSFDGLILLR